MKTIRIIVVLLVLITMTGCAFKAVRDPSVPGGWVYPNLTGNGGRYQHATVTSVYKSPIRGGTDVYRVDVP